MPTKTVSIVVTDGAGHILLLLQAAHKRHHDKWNILSGTIKDGETPFDAAGRELVEEIGERSFSVHVEHRIPTIFREPDGQEWEVYLFEFSIDPEEAPIQLNDENTEFQWSTYEACQALDLALPARADLLRAYEL